MKMQMLRFGLAGVAGFIVDSLVLYAAMAAGLGFLRGRVVSFVCAVVATWLINRHYTFAEEAGSMRNPHTPLWLEFWRYLLAMALGGFLNLATYFIVMRVLPFNVITPLLGVAAGSLAGMSANFVSAKWWVFRRRASAVAFRPLPVVTPAICMVVVQAVFWICHLHDAALPGLYFDAVNPDYLAARTLNPELPNPQYVMPTATIPILGNLYHGVQNYYVGLPVFAMLGFNMLALRVAQGLFGSGILVMLHLTLQRATGSMWLAFAGSLGLASELAFLGSFRTQMYIVIAGCFWLLWAIYLAFAPAAAKHAAGHTYALAQASRVPWFFSGVCTGLAVYSYFVFLFFVPVFVIMGWWHTRSFRAVCIWVLGFVLGMQTYVLGYSAMIAELNGLAQTLEWLRTFTRDLAPMAAAEGFMARLAYMWMMVWIALENASNDLMIFTTTDPGRWADGKMWLMVSAPFALIMLSLVRLPGLRREHDNGDNGLLASAHLGWLPLTFAAVSLIFGSRLWAHHYSPLVPVAYLILMLAAYRVGRFLPLQLRCWAGGVLAVCLVLGNLQQQNRFFERLEQTGGVGWLSNAINRMAEDALSLPADLVYVFPEWGFMAQFAFLTGNQRAYEVDSTPETLQRLAADNSALRLYYWKAEDEARYRDSLRAAGFDIRAAGIYSQRDQQPAFYWMEAAAQTPPPEL